MSLTIPASSPRSRLFLAIGLGALLLSPGILYAAAAPEMRSKADSIETSEGISWVTELMVVNSLDTGLYYDSLRCDIENLDPPAMGGGTRTTMALDFLWRRAQTSVSAGESHLMSITIPATAERARLTYRFHAHDVRKKPYVMKAVVQALPGEFFRDHPSRFAIAGGRKVELVIVEATGEHARSPGPAVLLVHGDGSSARQMMRYASQLSERGFTVMLAGMPGYGLSEGARDFAGPGTLAALNAALDTLARTPGVDSTRIAVWGVSRGGTAALNLAARRPGLRAAIAQSAIVDLWASHRAARAAKDRELASDVESLAGRDSASWRERSPVATTGSLKTPVLVVHAEDDPRAPVGATRAFAADLAARGLTVETKFVPKGGHPVGRHVAMAPAVAFLRRVLAP